MNQSQMENVPRCFPKVPKQLIVSRSAYDRAEAGHKLKQLYKIEIVPVLLLKSLPIDFALFGIAPSA